MKFQVTKGLASTNDSLDFWGDLDPNSDLGFLAFPVVLQN